MRLRFQVWEGWLVVPRSSHQEGQAEEALAAYQLEVLLIYLLQEKLSRSHPVEVAQGLLVEQKPRKVC